MLSPKPPYLLLIVLALGCKTVAKPSGRLDAAAMSDGSAELLTNSQGENQALASIGYVRAKMACTGWIYNPTGASQLLALVVASGHCATGAYPESIYAVLIDTELQGEAKVSFQFFSDTTDKQVVRRIKRIRYATMKNIDLAIFELDATYADLEKLGIKALPVAKQVPGNGDPVRVVGTPLGAFLSAESCTATGSTNVSEYYWYWFALLRNSCKSIRAQNSGSPMLTESGEVYAALNTTSVGANSKICYMSNPCETEGSIPTMVPGTSYAINVTTLKNCFNAEHQIEFGADCPLPPPTALRYSGSLQALEAATAAGKPAKTWDIKVTSKEEQSFVWKMGTAKDTNCQDLKKYSSPVAIGQVILAGRPIPSAEGLYVVCILGMKRGAAPDRRFPLVVVLSVDNTAPTLRPSLNKVATARDLRIDPVFSLPELAEFSYAYGKDADCSRVNWRPYLRIALSLKLSELPTTFCLKAKDLVGNEGPIFSYLLNAEKDVEQLEKPLPTLQGIAHPGGFRS